jgi:hypothetical protein
MSDLLTSFSADVVIDVSIITRTEDLRSLLLVLKETVPSDADAA